MMEFMKTINYFIVFFLFFLSGLTFNLKAMEEHLEEKLLERLKNYITAHKKGKWKKYCKFYEFCERLREQPNYIGPDYMSLFHRLLERGNTYLSTFYSFLENNNFHHNFYTDYAVYASSSSNSNQIFDYKLIEELDNLFTSNEAYSIARYLKNHSEINVIHLLFGFIIRRFELKNEIEKYEYNYIKKFLVDSKKPLQDVKYSLDKQSNNYSYPDEKLIDKIEKISNYLKDHKEIRHKLSKEFPELYDLAEFVISKINELKEFNLDEGICCVGDWKLFLTCCPCCNYNPWELIYFLTCQEKVE